MVASMNRLLRTLVLISAVVGPCAPTLVAAADQAISSAPLPPPLDLSNPTPPPHVYVPVALQAVVTYPGYTAAYPNTGCRGAYWARKPIFNADGLLVGYTRPQYMCPQWY